MNKTQEKFEEAIRKLDKWSESIQFKTEILRSRLKIIAYIILVVGGLVGGLWFNKWSLTNEIIVRSPVIFQTPVYVKKVEQIIVTPLAVAEEPTTILSKEQIINEYEYRDLIHKIWVLETSRGEAKQGYHKGCEALGFTNEFGYGVYQDICFPDFRESVKAVNTWLEYNIAEMGADKAVCYYNIGVKINDCDYVKNLNRL